ncbi:hypothetical protein [Pseudomonas sp. St386]|uniref:hypothetical protein n=1 Tax=Pseudomonas sp. St386 TaxID=2678256 RepID=UPI001BB3492B|nr:hypothetical protein [Pseudomonas sp. St386]
MSDNAHTYTSRALFVVMVSGLVALAISAALYLLDLPHDGYVFLSGMIAVLSVGAVSALCREGGAKLEDALPLLAGIAFFVWVAWRTFNK